MIPSSVGVAGRSAYESERIGTRPPGTDPGARAPAKTVTSPDLDPTWTSIPTTPARSSSASAGPISRGTWQFALRRRRRRHRRALVRRSTTSADRGRLRPRHPGAVPAGVARQRDRRARVPPGRLVPPDVRPREAGDRPGERVAAALRRRRLPGDGLGQRPARRRRTRAATRRSPPTSPASSPTAGPQVRRRPRRGRPARPDPAARQAGLAASGRTRSGTSGRRASGSRSGSSRCPAMHVDALRFTPDLDRAVPARPGARSRGRVPPVCASASGSRCAARCWPTTSGRRRARSIQRDVPLDGARIHHERRALPVVAGAPQPRRRAGPLLRRRRRRRRGRAATCGLRSVARRGPAVRARTAGATRCGWCSRRTTGRQSHLAAPDGAALRREVELVKELGFNGVRIHQKVEDPRFLALVRPARRAGLGRDAQRPRVRRRGRSRRLTREWLEVLDRDASSPRSSPGCRSTRAGACRTSSTTPRSGTPSRRSTT